MKLSKEHVHYLKGLAHQLKPVILIGDKGISESLFEECRKTLAHHELIKVKMAGVDRDIRNAALAELCASLDAVVIQRIGNVMTIFKRNHAHPKISFSGIKD